MADDEFVIGFSDSEWTGIAPLLEEDVAMSSLAQDELDHAAALFGLLAEATGTDPDVLAYDREPGEYRHARLLDHGRGDWAMTIARRYLYETADAVRLEALVDGSWAPAGGPVPQARPRGALPPHAHRVVVRTSGRERRASRADDSRLRWRRSPPTRERCSRTLDDEAALIEAGILAAPMAELEARWRSAIAPTFAGHGLPMPPPLRSTGTRPHRPRPRLRLAMA